MIEDELKEIFLAEALDGYEELNKLFTDLERNHANKQAIDAIFRITHTLKANAAGMGYEDIAEMAHTLEDVFSEIRSNRIEIESTLFNDLFRANDILGGLLLRVKDPKNPIVKYKGIKTKLEVIIRVARQGLDALPEEKKSKKNNTTGAKAASTDPATDTAPSNTTKTENSTTVSSTIDKSVAVQKNDDAESETTFQEETTAKVVFSDLIQIPVRKLDNLMNLVGELIIERDRVATSISSYTKTNELARLQRITSELQYSVMDVRLVQVNVLFNKFHRIVRDTAVIENKKVNLILEGTENEIDRNVLQIISDSLVHVVRNAISHGVESTQERLASGKTEEGTVTIRAKSEKDTVIIEVQDDGKGINPQIIKKKAIEKGLITAEFAAMMTEDEIINLIFEPGFSSVDEVTAVSGRGVGMDVVKRAIDSIGGKVQIKTALGFGSIFSMLLPSSMALKAALLFGLGNTEFAIPLTYTDAVIQLQKHDIHKIAQGLVAKHLKKNIAIVFLKDLFDLDTIEQTSVHGTFHKTFDTIDDTSKVNVIVVSYGTKDIGIVVDRLMQQKEIVEKPLAQPLENIQFISGATILGTGNVCLVLDIPSIVKQLFSLSKTY